MKPRKRMGTIPLAGLMLLTAPRLAGAQQVSDEAEARGLGIEAYIYGYPLVTMELTRRVMTNSVAPKDTHAPMGQFLNVKEYPDPGFKDLIAPNEDLTVPNADTLYSFAWLDLSEEPYVLSVPDEKNRFFMLPMLDAWTNVFADPGTRTHCTKPQRYAITGPSWAGDLPANMKELKSPTNLVWILGRTYSTGTPKDMKAVHAIQAQYSLVPLSAYGKPYSPRPGRIDPSIDMKTPVRDQVNALDASAFFQMMASLMKDNPPAAADGPIVEKMARIGIVPGEPFEMSELDPNVAKGLRDVPRAAQKEILAHADEVGKKANGWRYSTRLGAYGTHYFQRALVAAVGLGANLPRDAVHAISTADAAGQPYDGDGGYLMHFPKGQTPPVRGFWSLTMYDPKLAFAANPLNRFAIGSRNKLKYNEDGSLDILIQKRSPGRSKESNWLPAPSGKFVLMLRLYLPDETSPTILNDTWQPPPVRQTALVEMGGARPQSTKQAHP